MADYHSSIGYDQSKLLLSIQQLYLDGNPNTLDPCYRIGSMYKPFALDPVIKMDLNPSTSGIIRGDYTNMPFESGTLQSVFADPPFIIAGSGSKMASVFGSFPSLLAMQTSFDGLVSECARCILRDGILVIKCQDVVHDRRRYFTSHFLINTGSKYGFNLVDEFILLAHTRMHAAVHTGAHVSRSFHTKFLVFRFRRGRRDYVLS